ncbi:MAG: hypothetical protein LBS65_05290 [Desulfovibrio sp.]|nr:hypothetical protein [Desulfovibrio sp.]
MLKDKQGNPYFRVCKGMVVSFDKEGPDFSKEGPDFFKAFQENEREQNERLALKKKKLAEVVCAQVRAELLSSGIIEKVEELRSSVAAMSGKSKVVSKEVVKPKPEGFSIRNWRP